MVSTVLTSCAEFLNLYLKNLIAVNSIAGASSLSRMLFRVALQSPVTAGVASLILFCSLPSRHAPVRWTPILGVLWLCMPSIYSSIPVFIFIMKDNDTFLGIDRYGVSAPADIIVQSEDNSTSEGFEGV